MDEESVLEQVRDLYARSGLDGVLGALPGLRSVSGCLALVELGQEIQRSDPDGRAACVACAELLASRLGPGELGERELEDLRCDMALEAVWSWLGLKQTAAAEEALGRAAERLLEGTRDHVVTARLLDTWTALHWHRDELGKARQAARAALAHYEKAGERHCEGRMFYRLSLIEERIGDGARMEESLRLVSEAVARLESAIAPDLYLKAADHEVACLLALERYREARIRLFKSQGHYHRHGDAFDELRRAMLEGLSNAGLGKLHAAERELITALFGLCATGDAYMCGLLARELCAIYFVKGHADAARAGALQAIPVFQTQPLPPGGQKALLYLEMALEDGLADAGLLRRTARYLRELQHDPDAPVRPRS